ncbi:hypothetical protein [Mycobacterium sp. OAE908]|uniref:DUF6390 family protein n=1 Tax=Mycobacterium sp. OAE908 TaxID=2817899 RepID=UPI001AE16946
MTLFDQYAYPPNELGYCGPTDGGGAFGLAAHAKEFDGAWPYLAAIAEALGASDPLDEEVVSSYWVGGPALAKVDPAALLTRLRTSFTGQVTGLLDAVVPGPDVLAHHSFHVFVVYPWVRFLDRDAATALGVMQDCRIRWGTVESIDGEHAVITSPPLGLAGGELILGDPRPERVQWKKGELSLAPAPSPGSIVAAHWNWVCEQLEADQLTALEAATQSTLDLVNTLRGGRL